MLSDPVPAKVTRVNGNWALVMPLDDSKAPQSLALGAWVQVRDLKVGDEGNLLWISTASRGTWNFTK